MEEIAARAPVRLKRFQRGRIQERQLNALSFSINHNEITCHFTQATAVPCFFLCGATGCPTLTKTGAYQPKSSKLPFTSSSARPDASWKCQTSSPPGKESSGLMTAVQFSMLQSCITTHVGRLSSFSRT